MLRLPRGRTATVGKLGPLRFARGYYVYVGSAMANLAARVERHRRHRKKKHWHIDYLRPLATEFDALPIRGSERLECEVAHAMERILENGPEGFGCSDCRCGTHLFYSEGDPLNQAAFHRVLEQFRMRRPA